jgi:hypothetical protein
MCDFGGAWVRLRYWCAADAPVVYVERAQGRLFGRTCKPRQVFMFVYAHHRCVVGHDSAHSAACLALVH